MFFTYILENNVSHRHYIGSTNDLDRRLGEHNRGQTKSTRQKGIWGLIYKEEFATALAAKQREQVIKSYKGGSAFKKLIAGIVHR
ncbi:MAG: GIY-YIG nuclease family protein [Candidatus Roizmanbacteria bacterium]|nr:GIY-YIG nuclease family protein [Candidatus Roizmanbacteria bacterium]